MCVDTLVEAETTFYQMQARRVVFLPLLHELIYL
jgi:hypothetical protein